MIATLSAEKNYSRSHQETRQNWRIGDWAGKNGLSLSKIENHPNIGDVAVLMEFDEHSIWFSPLDTEIWTHCWQWCYKHEHPLSRYHKRRLLSIIEGIEYRRQQYQGRLLKRQKIQARLQKKLAAV
jgi:hypothetical protein